MKKKSGIHIITTPAAEVYVIAYTPKCKQNCARIQIPITQIFDAPLSQYSHR